jgi:hypothetical protein
VQGGFKASPSGLIPCPRWYSRIWRIRTPKVDFENETVRARRLAFASHTQKGKFEYEYSK